MLHWFLYVKFLYKMYQYRKQIALTLQIIHLYVFIRKYTQLSYEYYEDWVIVNNT